MTPLLRRVLTALMLLLVFVVAVLWAPNWLWAALMAGVVGLAAHEWARLSNFPRVTARVYALLLALMALSLPVVLSDYWPVFQIGLVLLAVVFWLVVAPIWLLSRWHAQQPFVRAMVGVVLLLPTWAALLYLHSRGPAALLGVMAIVRLRILPLIFRGGFWVVTNSLR